MMTLERESREPALQRVHGHSQLSALRKAAHNSSCSQAEGYASFLDYITVRHNYTVSESDDV